MSINYDVVLSELTFGKTLAFLKFVEKLEQNSEQISKGEPFSIKVTNSPDDKSISQQEIINQLQQWKILEVKNVGSDGNYLIVIFPEEFNNFKLTLEKSIPILDIVKQAREEAQKTLSNFVNSGVIQKAIKDLQKAAPMIENTFNNLSTDIPLLKPMESSPSAVMVSRDLSFNEYDMELKVRQTRALERILEILEENPNRRSSQIIEQLSDEELIPPQLSKRDLKKRLDFIIDTIKLGIKEEKLLDILSDFKPHRTTVLVTGIQTKSTNALTKLKNSVNKKLEGKKFHIVTNKGDWSNPKGYYQLKYLTDFDYSN